MCCLPWSRWSVWVFRWFALVSTFLWVNIGHYRLLLVTCQYLASVTAIPNNKPTQPLPFCNWEGKQCLKILGAVAPPTLTIHIPLYDKFLHTALWAVLLWGVWFSDPPVRPIPFIRHLALCVLNFLIANHNKTYQDWPRMTRPDHVWPRLRRPDDPPSTKIL